MITSPVGRRLLVASFALAAGACSSTTAGPAIEDATLVRIEPLAVDGAVLAGQYGGLATRERLVVRDAAAWEALWIRLTANVAPTPPLPAIAFEREQVIVVSAGTKPSGGHDIAVAEVREEGGALRVEVRERAPAARCITTSALTAPVAAVRMPRSALPVVWVERQDTIDCP